MSEIGAKQYICIFGGGAIRGLAYLGALRAMNELGIEIKSFAGSSVGAVFAVYAALDYKYEEFEKLFEEVNFDLFRDVQLNLAKNFAISKGEHFLNWLRAGIEKKVYGEKYVKNENKLVTFKDINKDIFIITSDINGCKPCVFSKYTTPDFEIAQAVRISTAMPGLLEPFKYEDKVLIDGDMMKSWPMWQINNLLCPDDCRVLEFRLEGSRYWPNVKNSIEYLNAVFATMSNFATENIIDTYKNNDKFDYIKIDTEHVLPVQFTLPQKDREVLIELGYNTTLEYFTKTLVYKKKDILPFYTVILDFLIKIRNGLTNNKISFVKSELGELFVCLDEAKTRVDESVYKSIVELKNEFYNQITKSPFLKHLQLKDRRLFVGVLDKLYDDVLERCMELESYITSFEQRE